jgi:hypothetical protein
MIGLVQHQISILEMKKSINFDSNLYRLNFIQCTGRDICGCDQMILLGDGEKD